MNAFFIVCAIAALATLPAAHVQAVIAAAASTLFESVPFILAAALVRRFVPNWGETLSALLGCGCASGLGARSLAVSAFTAMAFGPLVALARFIVACLVGRVIQPGRCAEQRSVLSEIGALFPYALGGSIFAAILGASTAKHIGFCGGVVIGLAIGFFSPCTLGVIALAATMRHISIAATTAMLAVAGIADLPTLRPLRSHDQKHDGFGYAVAATACAAIALGHGATLLNPRFTIALWLSSAALALLAWFYRKANHARLRWAPFVMASGMLFTHASPSYTVTETTLNNAAPGDAIDFRGVLARDGHRDALVRYAITCCRADAQPIVLRLDHQLPQRSGDWLSARGTIVSDSLGLALHVESYLKVGTPADPFLYR